jgi:FkbM family methyltransferase
LNTQQIESYAQNGEDIILNRCFPVDYLGTYIDVGAYHPVHDSVTKLFYDRGWSGINVEANPTLMSAFQSDRPRDLNLNFLVSNQVNVQSSLFVPIGNKGLGSSLNIFSGANEFEVYSVTSSTLTEIIYENNFFKIDFLKLDVEGGELGALMGFDFNICRPKIIVVEIYNNQKSNSNTNNLNKAMIFNDYTLVYFDGINNFYLDCSYVELSKHFNQPPNVLDNYIRHSEISVQRELKKHISIDQNISQEFLK